MGSIYLNVKRIYISGQLRQPKSSIYKYILINIISYTQINNKTLFQRAHNNGQLIVQYQWRFHLNFSGIAIILLELALILCVWTNASTNYPFLFIVIVLSLNVVWNPVCSLFECFKSKFCVCTVVYFFFLCVSLSFSPSL